MRHAPLALAEMSEAQRAIATAILAGSRSVVPPPMQVWLRTPALAERAIALGDYCRFSTSLGARLSELAILVVAAHWHSEYERQIHEPIAIQAGISSAIADAIRQRRAPFFAAADEEVVWRFTDQLLTTKRVDDATWSYASDILGIERITDLVGLLGYYALVSMTINVFEL